MDSAALAALAILAVGLPVVGQPVSLSAAAWREDLTVLANALTNKHYGFFTRISRDDFDAAVRDLDARIPQLTDAQIRVAMMRLAAMGGDPHTTLGSSPLGPPAFRQFALLLRQFDDGWYVVASGDSGAPLIGRRLVSLGGKPAEQLLDAVAPYVAAGNEWWLSAKAPDALRYMEILDALGLVGAGGFVRVQVEGLDEIPIGAGSWTQSLDERAGPDRLPLYRRRPADNYWFEHDVDRGLVYVRYRRCVEQAGNPSAPVWQGALDGVAAGAGKLVIDLRGNTGGDSGTLGPLIYGLLERIFRGGRPPRIYIVTDRETFSSAVDNAMWFKEAQQLMEFSFIRFAGEPTGGSPSSLGSVLFQFLPRSGMLLNYSTRFFGTFIRDNTLRPDLAVPLTFDQYRNGEDPVLDAISAEAIQ